MDSSPIILALVAIVGSFGTLVAFVIKALFKLLADNTKATNDNAKATTALVEETRKGNREAKERNGHLGEQNVHIAELVQAQTPTLEAIKDSSQDNADSNAQVASILSKSAVIAAEDRDILTGGSQVVNEQTVVHQTVKSKQE